MLTQRNYTKLNGFALKILGIVFMTIDHIGLILGSYQKTQEIAIIFRIFGRLAFPIFIFLLVEGIIHTKNIKKYFLRLGILGFSFLIGQLFLYFVLKGGSLISPVVDLLITASFVYLLKRKDKFSFFAIIPLCWAIVSFLVRNYENIYLIPVTWFPFFLRLSYSLFGPLLGVAFYYSNYLAKAFLESNENTKNLVGTYFERTTKNVICCVLLIVITILLCFIDENAKRSMFGMPWQIYSLFAALPIVFYNGKRGYNAKWFQYGCYVYFPTHLILIYGIYILVLIL